jgi:hypothetical protein
VAYFARRQPNEPLFLHFRKIFEGDLSRVKAHLRGEQIDQEMEVEK